MYGIFWVSNPGKQRCERLSSIWPNYYRVRRDGKEEGFEVLFADASCCDTGGGAMRLIAEFWD